MTAKVKSRLPMLLGEKRARISDVCRETGISRTTLTALYYEKGKGIYFDVLVKLCTYFNCNVGDILEVANGSDANAKH